MFRTSEPPGHPRAASASGAMVVSACGTGYNEETGLSVPHVAVLMVFLTAFLDSLSATISLPVLPYYALSFGVSTAAVGYLYASFSLASFFGTPFLGRLSDRYGRRTVLILSLVGGGVGSLGQAVSPCFSVLLAFRAFSGIWGAVMPTAQVYMGDVCSYAVLNDYMAKLSQVPSFSRTMGPGLGGGLSKFGLEVPILVDGIVNLLTAALVAAYVPESPAWAACCGRAAAEGGRGGGDCKAKGKGKGKGEAGGGQQGGAAVRVPWTAYALGFAKVFFAGQLSMQISMMAISMRAKFGWDALRVGYTAMCMALVGLTTGIWISPRVSSRIGAKGTANLGGFLATTGLLGLGLSERPEQFLAALALNKVGMGLWQASISTVLVSISEASNRGRVFSTTGMFNKVGATLGPIIAGHVADRDPKRLIWFVAASSGLVAAAILFCVRVPTPGGGACERLLRGFSDMVDDDLEDEEGSPEDYEAVGRLVGDLLTSRHYRWVSHREQVRELLELLLPEVGQTGAQQKEDLERLARHATCFRRALREAKEARTRQALSQGGGKRGSWLLQL